eukprot:m51a1_g13080 hypothetical protein (96) ;mRNA; r:1049-1568
MSHLLESYVEKRIQIVTNDGRNMLGTLRGYDQAVNIVLDHCVERVYSSKGVDSVTLGLYLIRGDDIAIVGEVDEERDKKIDLAKIRAEPLKAVEH